MMNKLTPEDIARLIYENHEEMCCTCNAFENLRDKTEWMKLGHVIYAAIYGDSALNERKINE